MRKELYGHKLAQHTRLMHRCMHDGVDLHAYYQERYQRALKADEITTQEFESLNRANDKDLMNYINAALQSICDACGIESHK